MCLQDIKLARAASPSQYSQPNFAVDVPIRVLVADLNRYSFSAWGWRSDGTLGYWQASFFVPIGEVEFPVGSMSKDHPGLVVNVVDLGQAVTGEIWMRVNSDGDPPTINVGDSAWNQPFEEIIR